MKYVDELLRMQEALARELTQEPDGAQRQLRLPENTRRGADEPEAEKDTAKETPDGAEEAAQAAPTAAEGETDRGAQALLEELTRMDAAARRIERRTAQGGRSEVSFEQDAADLAARSAPGAADASAAWLDLPMAGASEAAQARAERSMGEISRFFERDARRYGG